MIMTMIKHFVRNIMQLELEEKILNAGAFIALLGVCMPWLGGEWLGGEFVSFSGFAFYTSFMGIAAFVLHTVVLLITAVPAAGGSKIVKDQYKNMTRLGASVVAATLSMSSLSVLTKITFEFSRMEVRFGIYVTIIGGLVASLYSFLRVQDENKQYVHELFRHPEEPSFPSSEEDQVPYQPSTPAPPPPPTPTVEEHRMHPRKHPVALHRNNR